MIYIYLLNLDDKSIKEYRQILHVYDNYRQWEFQKLKNILLVCEIFLIKIFFLLNFSAAHSHDHGHSHGCHEEHSHEAAELHGNLNLDDMNPLTNRSDLGFGNCLFYFFLQIEKFIVVKNNFVNSSKNI